MESRVERYKKIKNQKKQRRFRIMVIIVCLLFFLTSLYKVDNTLREIMCIHDKNICRFDIESGLYRLHIMGDEYIIDKEQIDYYLDKIATRAKRVFRKVNYYKDKLFDS